MFVNGHRWLEEQLDEVPGRSGTDTVLERCFAFFDGLLDVAAGGSPGTELRASQVRELNEVLVRALREADRPAPVVLALLRAIDSRYGERLRDEFYRSNGGGSAVALGSGVVPKPRAAFGADLVPVERFVTGRSQDRRLQAMAAEFGRIAVPPTRPIGDPPPALHLFGNIPPAFHTGPWTVATVDLVANSDELAMERDDLDRFWISAYRSAEVAGQIEARLAWALERCREAPADLVVIPELALDKSMLGRLATELSEWRNADATGLLPMLIVGQLHEPDPKRPGRYRNRPAVITPDGLLDWPYWKKRAFEWDGLREALGEPPPYLVAIDSPLGRVVVTICLDFLDAAVHASILRLQPSVVVIPAMTRSGTVEDFMRKSEELPDACRAVTVFCNASMSDRECVLGFARTNTKASPSYRVHSYRLPEAAGDATVGMFHLEPTTDGLRIRLSPPFVRD